MAQIDPRTAELAILQVLSMESRGHKFNMIGRPYQMGTLEQKLGLRFTNQDREIADRAFEALRGKSLIRSTYSDLADPERWVEITEAGREALERGVLDALDDALLHIGRHLPEIRAGAWEAVYSNRPDALRQAAHSGRELIDQTLKEGAPDAAVRQLPGFTPDPSSASGITRRQRLRYLMKQARGRVSNTDLKIAEEACDLVIAVDAKLQAESHSRTQPMKQEIIDTLTAAEIALRALLTQ